MSKLHCPSCQSALLPTEVKAGPMLICRNCGGKGISAALLDQALTPLTYRRLVSQFKTQNKTSRLICPTCHLAMKSVRTDVAGQEHSVDICQNCGLSWFNHQEFESIPRRQDTVELFQIPDSVLRQLPDVEYREGKLVSAQSQFRLSGLDFGFGWDKREGRIGLFRMLLALMLIPVERDHRSRTKPWFSIVTILSIAFVSLLGWELPNLIDDYALRSGLKWSELFVRLISYGYFHGGWEHLLGNLYYLWFFADNIEDEYGGPALVVSLLAGTAFAGFCHLFFDSAGPGLIGISGGVSAIGMIYTLCFPRAKVAFFLGLGWARFPAYILSVIWILLQVLLARDQMQGMTNISAIAHIGGAVFGLLAYFLYFRRPAR